LAAAPACRFDNHLRACEIGRQRLFEKNRFSKLEGTVRNGGLEIGRDRDGDYRNGILLDQCLPTSESARDIGSASKLGRSLRVSSRQRNDLAAGILTECRDEDGSTVIAPDDANSDHSRVPTRVRNALAQRL
jgi:hypothetical protein